MARPLTRAQALQNRAFLRTLARTGNARAAAREVGAPFSTMMHRRGAHPAFAQAWDAASASAQARLRDRGGVKGPEARAHARAAHAEPTDAALRTTGGEPVVVRVRGGRIQVRAAQPNKLTAQCEAAFLMALSATSNVRLSAAAAGASVAAFYRRRRNNPAFAREWTKALALGYDRLELALLEGWSEAAHEHDAWAHNDPPPVPPMNAAQALQLMYLHQKEARALAPPEPLRLRPGETNEARIVRLTLLHEAWMEREREKYHVAEAARAARGRRSSFDDRPDPHEPPRPTLPDLAQVTGWSRARPELGENADPEEADADGKPALFGGWRIEEMRRRMGE